MTTEESLKLFKEVQKLTISPVVELFNLDTTPAGDDSVLSFHNGTKGIRRDSISFKGVSYIPMPIEVKGFETTSSGEPPRPTLLIANYGGWVSALCVKTHDLVGAILTRRRTFACYLDGEPEAAGVEYPPDIFVIEQKLRENRLLVEFELGSGLDLDGLSFPTRKVSSGYCGFNYRGPGCSFGGRYCVTDSNNNLLAGMDKYRGNWNRFAIYNTNDTIGISVGEEFHVYRSIDDGVSGITKIPPNALYWTLIQRYRGKYSNQTTDYTTNDVVYTETADGRKLMHVVVWSSPVSPYVPVTSPPPNRLYWATDFCSKTLSACKRRFDPQLAGAVLNFGGYPGTLNVPEV